MGDLIDIEKSAVEYDSLSFPDSMAVILEFKKTFPSSKATRESLATFMAIKELDNHRSA